MNVPIQIVLQGLTPLLAHNPQMVDPECQWTRAIKAITGKRKKTDEDLSRIEELEWYGGIYTAEVGGRVVVTQPTSKVRKCMIGAARISKLGKMIERALITVDLNVPLIYDGSDKARDIERELARLFANKSFHSRLSVGVGNKRVMRVRPQFYPWALIMEAVFIDDAGLNFDDMQRIVALAGRAERIGDNRVNGYGSFLGHVRVLGADSPPIEPTINGVKAFFNDLERKEAAA